MKILLMVLHWIFNKINFLLTPHCLLLVGDGSGGETGWLPHEKLWKKRFCTAFILYVITCTCLQWRTNCCLIESLNFQFSFKSEIFCHYWGTKHFRRRDSSNLFSKKFSSSLSFTLQSVLVKIKNSIVSFVWCFDSLKLAVFSNSTWKGMVKLDYLENESFSPVIVDSYVSRILPSTLRSSQIIHIKFLPQFYCDTK